VRVLGAQGLVAGLEALGDVAQEDQAENDVLVVRRFEVLAQLVGGEEELSLEAAITIVGLCSSCIVVSNLSGSSARHSTTFRQGERDADLVFTL